METNDEVTHIVMYSGGLGSWYTAKKVIEKYGKENTLLLFTDTLIEDEDLYRFLIESSAKLFGVWHKKTQWLSDYCLEIPRLENSKLSDRKESLKYVREFAFELISNLVWLCDGRTPWEVYEDRGIIGNSKMAPCSMELKKDVADKYIHDNFRPNECICYVGIDWSESHRYERLVPKKFPYIYKAPLTEPPIVSYSEIKEELNRDGIELPKLYKEGFPHNNCGGFCCKAGKGHFADFYSKMPERFNHHAEKELSLMKQIDRNNTVLTETVEGEIVNISLIDLAKRSEENRNQFDMFDSGGCGCFID